MNVSVALSAMWSPVPIERSPVSSSSEPWWLTPSIAACRRARSDSSCAAERGRGRVPRQRTAAARRRSTVVSDRPSTATILSRELAPPTSSSLRAGSASASASSATTASFAVRSRAPRNADLPGVAVAADDAGRAARGLTRRRRRVVGPSTAEGYPPGSAALVERDASPRASWIRCPRRARPSAAPPFPAPAPRPVPRSPRAPCAGARGSADLLLEAVLLRRRRPDDAPALGVRLLDDEVGLAPRLLLHVVRGALGGDERRAEERLELAVLRRLGLELLEPVGEVGALAPHLLEAVRDVAQQAFDDAACGSRGTTSR